MSRGGAVHACVLSLPVAWGSRVSFFLFALWAGLTDSHDTAVVDIPFAKS